MRIRLLWAGLAALIALAALAALMQWLGKSERVLAQEALPAPFEADPRWLALVYQVSLSQTDAQRNAASIPPTVHYHLTDRVIAGRVFGPAPVVISVTRGGALQTTMSANPIPYEGAYLYSANLTWGPFDLPPQFPQAGDVLWVAQSDVAISLTVPNLSGLVTAETDAITGAAPANVPLTLYVYPFDDAGTVFTQTVSSDGAGVFQSVWSPAVNLRPRDSGYIRFAPDTNRSAYARFVAPFLRVQSNALRVAGFSAPRSVVTVTATSGGESYTLPGYESDAVGAFEINDYSGGPRLLPGSLITLTAAGQTVSFTMPPLTAQSDRANGQVIGSTSPNQRVEIGVAEGPLPEFDQTYYFFYSSKVPEPQLGVTATVSGQYTATVPLSSAAYGAAYVTTPEGHQVYARFAVPFVAIRLGAASGIFGEYWLRGQLDEPLVPITVSVQGPSGYLKAIREAFASSSGYFSDPFSGPYGSLPTNLSLDSGDVITLATPSGAPMVIALPTFTALADVEAQTVSGSAPPNTPVTIRFNPDGVSLIGVPNATATPMVPVNANVPASNYTFVVTATAQGLFQLNFAPIGHFTNFASGEAQINTPEGHALTRRFQTLQNCLPTFSETQVGGNLLQGYGPKFYPCPLFTVRLRDAAGRLKFEQTDINGQIATGFYVWMESNGEPILVAPGDRIEASSGSQTQSFTAPLLSVSLDPINDRVTGTGLPGSILQFVLYDFSHKGFWPGNGPVAFTTTISAQGTYTIAYPVEPGDLVRADYRGDNPHFFCLRHYPYLARLPLRIECGGPSGTPNVDHPHFAEHPSGYAHYLRQS